MQQTFKTILAIETSCDETSAAIIRGDHKRVTLLSNIVSSSASLQSKYGGVIPEFAAREQLKAIIPVIKESLFLAKLKPEQIEAIAVTVGPGLIGSLLVGVETAKTLSLVWQKPLIPVNHLVGHFYAHWLDNPTPPKFPCLGLLISGGHTDLVLMKDHHQFEYISGTRDDAAGECFDKGARLIDLPYPGGPAIAQAAQNGNPQVYSLPKPMLNSTDFDFSFSGLKTAILNLTNKIKGGNKTLTSQQQADLAASIQETISQVLIAKLVAASQSLGAEQVMIAGGVAANHHLKTKLSETFRQQLPRVAIHFPKLQFCTDNAAMIAAAAYFNPIVVESISLQANPGLNLI
ncbi:tRNA (adenosine(37)-N6)-threonylcarbamoyltransferase complex transferase subunit TsaD [Patescibacteria group bacterium]|nr:tRNA (adenosine(37)-N6)-threonylcarbamoyltransferase complex transferase subunit TsaD [Patescibacteria group bacterium]